ncbi:RNase P subunit p30-domain-containing protein [Cerioporus squamosus]|nr:RNase P subunit p30-domain-containing protein [Cerioporus squamosus]
MFVDLNVPVPTLSKQQLNQTASKKGKGKQEQSAVPPAFTPGQVAAIESRIDTLVHLGYTVFAFNQTVERKVDPKTFVNTLNPLLGQLRKRDGVVYLKRLTIVLDEESEKGFGLTNGNSALFAPYDLLALAPTTAASFSLACLTHTQPTPLTTHIISLPLTLPRLPFNLKHTLVRAALKNGAVFEINYVGALGGEGDPALTIPSGSESGAGAKRNWWAAAREVARVTKGRASWITVLGVAQDVAHDASSKVPQSLILRAHTRKTYRAVFSEPKVVIPQGTTAADARPPDVDMGDSTLPTSETPSGTSASAQQVAQSAPVEGTAGKKRVLEPSPKKDGAGSEVDGARKKKKKNKLQG